MKTTVAALLGLLAAAQAPSPAPAPALYFSDAALMCGLPASVSDPRQNFTMSSACSGE